MLKDGVVGPKRKGIPGLMVYSVGLLSKPQVVCAASRSFSAV